MPFTDNAGSENVRGTLDCFHNCVKKIVVLKNPETVAGIPNRDEHSTVPEPAFGWWGMKNI